VAASIIEGAIDAEAAGLVRLPLHAPTSGYASALIAQRPTRHASGTGRVGHHAETDVRTSGPNCTRSLTTGLGRQPPWLDMIRNAGVSCAWAARSFPTAVKLNPARAKAATRLIINALNARPYTTATNCDCVTRQAEVVAGIEILMHLSWHPESGADRHRRQTAEAIARMA